MSPQDKCALSFYRELEAYDDKKAVQLCRHIENQRIYLKKIRSVYNRSVYEQLKKANLPFVPKIEELIEDDEGRLIIIEEYVSGKTLAQELEEGVMSPERAVGIITDLAEAIADLQSLNPPVVHRDIKPDNIILNGSDRIMLIDFNTAKHITNQPIDTIAFGTPGYAAPEQYGFGSSGEKTDVYALGVVFNEMLTGHGVQEGLAGGELGELIRVCVNLDTERRPSITEICNWLRRWNHQPAMKAQGTSYSGTSYSGPAVQNVEKPQSNRTQNAVREYHPNYYPGFRSGKTFNKIVSVFFTLVGVGAILSIEEEGGNATQWMLLKLCFTICYLFGIFWVCNYRNIRRHAIGANHPVYGMRVLGAIVTYGIICVILIVIFGICSQMAAN